MNDLISRQVIKQQMIKYGFTAQDMTVTEFVEDCLSSAQQQISDDKLVQNAENDYGAKDSANKPRLSLVPRQILFDICKVREFGNNKYGDPDNWKLVDAVKFEDAAFRHFLKYLDDPDGVDEESGISHLAHLACNVAFLCELRHKSEREKL